MGIAVTVVTVLLVVPAVVLVLRQDPGRLSETSESRTGRFVPTEPPAGPDAEAMGVAGAGRVSTEPEVLGPDDG